MGQEDDGMSFDVSEVGGFHEVLGYRVVQRKQGMAELELSVQPKHLNLGGVLHGGVLMSLLDVVCAMAGSYCVVPGNIRKSVTLSLSTQFTGQVSGGTIRAIATCKASGSRIFNSSGEILDEQGKVLAIAQGTFRFRSGSESAEGVPLKRLS